MIFLFRLYKQVRQWKPRWRMVIGVNTCAAAAHIQTEFARWGLCHRNPCFAMVEICHDLDTSKKPKPKTTSHNSFVICSFSKPGTVTHHKSNEKGEITTFFCIFNIIFSIAYGLHNKKSKYTPFTVDLHW